MNKFIPYEKLSKKKKRELDAKKRGVWHINPVTRKPANSKAYNRRKVQKWDDPGSVPFTYSSYRGKTNKKGTDFNIISTLKPVLEKMVAGATLLFCPRPCSAISSRSVSEAGRCRHEL